MDIEPEFIAPVALLGTGIGFMTIATVYKTAENLGVPGSVGVTPLLAGVGALGARAVWSRWSAKTQVTRAERVAARDWADWVTDFPEDVQETVQVLSTPWDAVKKWAALGLGRLPDPANGDPGEWPQLVPSQSSYPPDRGIISVPVGLRLRLRMSDGQERRHYEEKLKRIAVALDADAARVVGSRGRVICLDVRYFDPIKDLVPVPVPAEPVDLKKLNPGMREDGEHWLVPLFERNILGVGLPGSGKSGFVASLLMATAPAARDGLLVNLMIDMKFGVEAARMKGLLHRTATDAGSSGQMLEWLRWTVIEERGREMEALGLSKHVITTGAPMYHLIIDEIAELLDDPKTRTDFLRVLVSIARLGRALGVSISGYTQLANKKILDMLRDLFQIRIGMRLSSPEQMVMVYGDHHAAERGADNTNIPDKGSAGIAYVFDDSSSQIVRVRAYFVSDENLAWAAQTYPPYPHPHVQEAAAQAAAVGGQRAAGGKPVVSIDSARRRRGDGEIPNVTGLLLAEIDAEAEELSKKIGDALAEDRQRDKRESVDEPLDGIDFDELGDDDRSDDTDDTDAADEFA
ncbi:FtsK/SpoIIIE domain-containing protein [Nocardia sp. NPDC004168]|uniref:FtsK/SpoIIIE domain-containing protein n=1 Tax=Nocardia sp. NPDC004168 TaxID=3154452 RepID=UPI00339DE313